MINLRVSIKLKIKKFLTKFKMYDQNQKIRNIVREELFNEQFSREVRQHFKNDIW